MQLCSHKKYSVDFWKIVVTFIFTKPIGSTLELSFSIAFTAQPVSNNRICLINFQSKVYILSAFYQWSIVLNIIFFYNCIQNTCTRNTLIGDDYMDKEKIGLFIKELRKEKNQTQRELAEKLHVTDKAVSKWERGLSIPDTAILPDLARELDISIHELLQGERNTSDIIETAQAEKLLVDTVRNVNIVQKKKLRLWKSILFIQGILFLILFIWGKDFINFGLKKWYEKNESLYHRSEISIHPPACTERDFTIERENTNDQFIHLYHVYGINHQQDKRLLFTIKQKGMNLHREPILKWDEQYLYVIFDGIDNEDIKIRIYDGKVGADPQAFLPKLVRYSLTDGSIDEINISKKEQSLLLDAFTYQDKSIYITARFKGIIFGLNLGFYTADGIYVEGVGSFDINLIGSGGMQTMGCLIDDSYYICGQDGIYEINLITSTISKVMEKDLSQCILAKLVYVKETGSFQFIGEMATKTDKFNNVIETNIIEENLIIEQK